MPKKKAGGRKVPSKMEPSTPQTERTQQRERHRKSELWYQTNLFWGCATTASAVVLSVIAAMLKDFRWLLVVAWPFAATAVWTVTSIIASKRIRVLTNCFGSIVIAGALWWLYLYLKPKPTDLSEEQKTEFTKILKTARFVPDYTIIACPDADESACIYAANYIKLFQRAGWKVQGPFLERVRLAIPDGSISIVDYGPPLVHPDKPDEGVSTKMTP